MGSDFNDITEVQFPAEPLRLCPNCMTRLAKAICDGDVVTSRDMDPELVPDVFLPLKFLQTRLPVSHREATGGVWAWRHEAVDEQVGDYQCMYAVRFVHVQDWDVLHHMVHAEISRRANGTFLA